MFRRIAFLLLFLVLVGALIGAVIATGFAALSGTNRWLVVGLTIVGLLLFAGMARRVFTRNWAPVGDLIDATQRLGDGDTGVRITTSTRGPFRTVASSFNRMAVRLEEEDDRRRRLLADLGHEMRTPLTVIRGEIEAVLGGLHPPADLSHVIDEVELMERLLEDLRLLALAEAGQLALETEPTDLGALVADVMDSFSTIAEGRGIAATVTTPGTAVEVDVDPHRMHQVLANLISNAMRHAPDRGQVTAEVSVDADMALISIRDTGPGIPVDRLGSVFDRFEKAGESAGTGLGLAIAKYLVEAHAGLIEAGNHPDGGAVFSIWLPL